MQMLLQTYVDNSAVVTYSQVVSNTSTVLRNKTINGNFFTLKVNDVSVLTSLLSTADFTMLTVSNNAVATQSWVTLQSYLTALPSTASFTTLTIGSNAVATLANLDTSLATAKAYADGNLVSAKSYTDAAFVASKQYTDTTVTNYVSQLALSNKTLTGNFNILKVNAVGVLTALPSTTSFTTLTIGTDNVTTEFYADNKAKAYADARIVLAKAYMDDANFVSPTTISNKTLTGNFSILRVNDVDVLSTLPSIASFITLTIGLNAVATQAWVTSQIYLTRTIVSNKMVNGNSRVLKVNDVSTNSFTEYSKFYNIDYRT